MDEPITIKLTFNQLTFLADHLVSAPLRHNELIDIYCKGICESAEHVSDQYDYHKDMLLELADIPQIKAVDEARRAWLETIK